MCPKWEEVGSARETVEKDTLSASAARPRNAHNNNTVINFPVQQPSNILISKPGESSSKSSMSLLLCMELIRPI